ncbi:Hypothetical Protein FCC1311_081842 [Hondaea fermentalgiana]|uniref:Uncharacterized protein n=1 Tax=Hondaea fermentalgiana TaxID=2315210 RepID=A0A2R5GNT2_9STRA|nr:Hypothetical Protein FCC1311_081842 [Hondaea fermentalgiana]|eukprot:GBG31959.1 Hypothetical Protein FCC1311_081842 [Hondaea fermentalgiana]
MLPPKELKVTIDKELVRQGRWRDAVEQLLSRRGHEAFISVEDALHDPCPAEDPGVVQSIVRQNRSDQRQLSSETIQRTLFRATTLHEIGMARFLTSEAPDFRSGQDTAVLNAHAPLAEALPLYSTLADQLSIDNERDLRAIQAEEEQLSPRQTENAETKETQPQTLFARPQTPKVTGNPLVDADEELRASMQSLVASGAESEDGLVDALVRHEESLAKELDLLRRRDHLGAVAAAAKLQKQWSKPLRQKAELRRLGRATQPVQRPEWSFRHLGALGNQRTVPRSSKKQKAKADRSRASLQRELGLDAKAELASTVPSASTAAHHGDVPLNVRLHQERLHDQVQRKLQTAIKRAILYTRLVDALKTVSQANALRYRNAETHAARNHAFDQTTKLVVEIRLATCSLLEGITQWRQARNELTQSTDASHVPQMYPFIWDGGNLIVRMQRRLDFLRENKELSHWYGDAMPLEENPFMLAVPIRERPESPRQATRRVLVDGKQVLRVSEKLAALREQDVARMNAAWTRVSGGPLWWPRCSNDEWIRVRAAEKVIRSEMERHDQLRAKLCE